MMIVISLVRVNNMKKPIWDGRVVNKTEKRKTKTENYGDDEHLVHYMEYTVYLQGADGSKKKIRIQNNREWYDYLNIGDYVRYHPSFSTYEKYDKSHDSYIFCNICGKKNDIRENYCCFCKSLLFK
ncbi:hypothetical protein SDC9_174096 [bioreactor metagenome]|uniref:Uncharacterized protein n=1 Tax=bioreactor metagenome TaxID=1076179 RepID=A0A645GI72_9ZZZZ